MTEKKLQIPSYSYVSVDIEKKARRDERNKKRGARDAKEAMKKLEKKIEKYERSRAILAEAETETKFKEPHYQHKFSYEEFENINMRPENIKKRPKPKAAEPKEAEPKEANP